MERPPKADIKGRYRRIKVAIASFSHVLILQLRNEVEISPWAPLMFKPVLDIVTNYHNILFITYTIAIFLISSVVKGNKGTLLVRRSSKYRGFPLTASQGQIHGRGHGDHNPSLSWSLKCLTKCT